MPKVEVAISEVEERDITRAYQKLIKPLESKLKGDDRELLDKAFEVAMEGHKYQRRRSGEPYIFHPIEVARICHEEIELGPTAVICALLHDVVEDTDFTIEDIEELFNPNIAMIVNGLTKLDGLYNDAPQQAENLKKVLSTITNDVRVVFIKMADRLHNLRTIDAMPRHKQLNIAAETGYIYAPLAHRLGLYNIKTEFEDIILKIQDNEAYTDIVKKINASEDKRQKYIESFLDPLSNTLNESGIKHRITSRSKSIASIYKKVKNKDVPFEKIYDLFAVRFILDVPKEQEKAKSWQVYSLITDVYKPIPERLKDWITTPKGNGYESLHTTVIGPDGRFVEVQIRTERMDAIAERGFAAHWKYKGIKDSNDVYSNWLDSIREILDSNYSNAIEFLNDFKTNLFKEEIYVFTPKGDMKILAKGATALDFAFDIHTMIGYTTTSVKVNDKLVPLGYELQNGDRIEVTTNKNQKPNEDWLKYVTTGKARSKIRSAMKEERRRIGEIGRESLERKLRHLKVDFEENVDTLVKFFGADNRIDLYYYIAEDIVKLTDLKHFEVIKNKLVLKQDETKIQEKKEKQVKGTKTDQEKDESLKNQIYVNGEPASQYSFSISKCCNPVPGDDIFAFLSMNSGLKIHRTNCPNAGNLVDNYGYRTLKADWRGKPQSEFVVTLMITGVDEGIGVLQKITNSVSEKLGINIKGLSIEGDQGYFEGKLKVQIKNTDQLAILMKELNKIPGISTVKRLESK